jgi:hypothetical protein
LGLKGAKVRKKDVVAIAKMTKRRFFLLKQPQKAESCHFVSLFSLA